MMESLSTLEFYYALLYYFYQLIYAGTLEVEEDPDPFWRVGSFTCTRLYGFVYVCERDDCSASAGSLLDRSLSGAVSLFGHS